MAARRATQPRLFDDSSPRSGRIRAGWDTTVRELRRTDRLEVIDEALIKLGRVWADECDEARTDTDTSRYVRGNLYRGMLEAIRELRAVTRPDVDADSFEGMFARLVDTVDPVPGD